MSSVGAALRNLPVFLGVLAMPFSGTASYVVDFEGVTKGSYASNQVILTGLEWCLAEALIGTLDGDKKNGERALRMRGFEQPAVAVMCEDKSGGIGTISFLYAGYGNDTGQPALYVEYSTDGGVLWSQAGTAINAFPAALTNWTAVVNAAGHARIRLRTGLADGDNRRINVDDIELSDFHDGTPEVATGAVTGITPGGARVGGNVVDDHDDPVTVRGVAWNLTGFPTTNDNTVAAGSGTGSFEVLLTGLTAAQTVYARAFAQNAAGAGYGDVAVFTTACFTNAPVLHPVTNRHGGGFTVCWDPVEGAAAYLLDIAADTRFHSGGTGTVFGETMKTTPVTRTLAEHDALAGFDFSGVYTYCSGGAAAAGDVRSTHASSGYTDAAGDPASGGANIWFTATEGEHGFCIGNIDARPYTELRLGFGYRKVVTNRNASFSVSWSTGADAVWHPLAVSGLPAENAGAGWYHVGEIPLPQAAATNALELRWVKSGATAMRIDDVLLRGDGGAASLHPLFTAVTVSGASFRVDRIRSGTWWVRIRAVGAGDCVSAPSAPRSVAVSAGGSLLVIK